MLPNDENLTAYFKDIATRHTAIQHTDADPRFFELEWDEMVSNGKALSNDHFYLILQDYKEQFDDNKAEYYPQFPVISFMIVKAVKPGKTSDKKAVYQEARRIAKGIIAKMRKDGIDSREDCEADVPVNVAPPSAVFIKTLSFQRIAPPFFAHSFGVLATIKIHTDIEEDFPVDEDDWLPLS